MKLFIQNYIWCLFFSQSGGSSSLSDVLLPDDYADSLTDHSTTFGNVIPNRIFVGGLDYRVRAAEIM